MLELNRKSSDKKVIRFEKYLKDEFYPIGGRVELIGAKSMPPKIKIKLPIEIEQDVKVLYMYYSPEEVQRLRKREIKLSKLQLQSFLGYNYWKKE